MAPEPFFASSIGLGSGCAVAGGARGPSTRLVLALEVLMLLPTLLLGLVLALALVLAPAPLDGLPPGSHASTWE